MCGRGTDDGGLLVCLYYLPVPVQYLPLVTEAETSEQLEEHHLYIVRVEGSRVLFHVVAQVCVLERGQGTGGLVNLKVGNFFKT